MRTLTHPVVEADEQLESVVRAWALQPHRWAHLVQFTEPRFRLRLFADDELEVRLLTWLPGQGSGLHDHGDSAGCLHVVRGDVWEQIADPAGVLHSFRRHTGATSSFRNNIIHNVENRGAVGAVTIHAYRPVLTEFQRYEVVNGVVVPLAD